MIFFFGTTEREQERGVVADRCATCREFRWLDLIELRRVWHAYFIPLGKGRAVGAALRCRSCGSWLEVDPGVYPEVLSATAPNEVELEAALGRTRPDLAARLSAIDALANPPSDPAYRALHDDAERARLAEAAESLKRLEGAGVDTREWIERLRRFSQRLPAERDLLLAELKGFARAKLDRGD